MRHFEESLLLEVQLAASNIGIGLTSIRRHDFTTKGRFYAALFALTVGLERLMKVVVVLDYTLMNGAPPPNEYLKKEIGHRIDRLFSKTRDISGRRHFSIDHSKIDDPIIDAMIDILAKFAGRSRYYNLDTITGTASQDNEEPLAEWSQRVGDVIIQRHLRWTRNKARTMALAANIDKMGGVVVNHRSDDGIPIVDSRHLALEAILIETKQKYSVLYLHAAVDYCIAVLQELNFQMSPILFIHEAFARLRMSDRKAILGRKTWDPYAT